MHTRANICMQTRANICPHNGNRVPKRRSRGGILLHIPSVLVRIDGFTEGQLPERPDLLLITPTKGRKFSWKWETRPKTTSGVVRTQLPLLMTSGLTPFTAQGMTAEWALTHLVRFSHMTWHQWWYQAYVALSRARNAVRLGHHGSVPAVLRNVLALGPEPYVRAELARLQRQAILTRTKVAAACEGVLGPRPEGGGVEHTRCAPIPAPLPRTNGACSAPAQSDAS